MLTLLVACAVVPAMELDTSSGLVELASGVDSLYMSGWADPPSSVFSELEAGWSRAEEADGSVMTEFGGSRWLIAPRAFGKYRFCLEHDNGRVGVTPSARLPTFRVQPVAEFLHSVGAPAAVEWFRAALEYESGDVRLSTSRLDLHADWQGWNLSGDDRHRFVARSTATNTREESDLLTGLEFGRRKTGTVSARIYDKTHQVKVKGGDWVFEMWGSAYQPGSVVLRTEFEFGRLGLRELSVDSPEEALTRAPELWAYATDEWLTLRDPTADDTKSRWPIAPEWRSVQRASLRGCAVPAERIRAAKREGSLRLLMPQLNGSLASFAALTGVDSPEDAAELLPYHVRTYEQTSRRSFRDRVEEKRGPRAS